MTSAAQPVTSTCAIDTLVTAATWPKFVLAICQNNRPAQLPQTTYFNQTQFTGSSPGNYFTGSSPGNYFTGFTGKLLLPGLPVTFTGSTGKPFLPDSPVNF